MVPEGWTLRCLEDLALVERGRFIARPRNDPKYYGGKIPFVQTGDVVAAGTYLRSYSQTLNDEGLKVSRIFPKNTILITIAANIGDTAIATFDVACPDSVVAIQPYPDYANYRWLKFVLETHKKKLDGLATQNAQKNINLEVLKPLQILTPPIEEQHKIAMIISTCDKAIATVEKLIENSRQQKKALMQQLLKGRARFPEFRKPWGTVSFSEVAEINPGKSNRPKDGYVSFVSMNDVSEEAQLLSTQVRQYSDVDSGFTAFKDHDVLIAKITPCFENGKGAYVKNLKNGIGFGSTEFHVLRARDNSDSRFIYNLTNTREFRVRGEANMQGSAGQKRVPTDYIKNYRVRVPSDPREQTRISDALATVDSEINNYRKQLKILLLEKQALMQKLLTGQLRIAPRVREKEPNVA